MNPNDTDTQEQDSIYSHEDLTQHEDFVEGNNAR